MGGVNLKTELGKVERIGLYSISFLFICVIFMANFISLHGAVTAPGVVEVLGKPKVIQHLDGGIVEKIYVEEGQNIAKGERILTLDNTMLKANMKIYMARLSDTLAVKDRLLAELGEEKAVIFNPLPDVLLGFDPKDDQLSQVKIFNARQSLNIGKKERIKEKIKQYKNQSLGILGLGTALLTQEKLLTKELMAMKKLNKRKMMADNDLLIVQRNLADIQGQIAEGHAELSKVKNLIHDSEIELLQSEREFNEDIVKSLKENKNQIYELTQQLVSTNSKLKRIDVLSPINGKIHELRIVTESGIVKPGEVIAQVVPSKYTLYFEVKVSPVAIDQVYLNQKAVLRFTSFNQKITPELNGVVDNISPTSITDPNTNQSYYKVKLGVNRDELTKLGTLTLIPGMPVEAHLQTTERTIMSYLLKPLTDQINRAFIEE